MNIDQAVDGMTPFYQTVDAIFEDSSERASKFFSGARCCIDDNKVVISDIVLHGTDFLDIANACCLLGIDVKEFICLSAYLYAKEILSKKTMFWGQRLSLVSDKHV